VDPLRTSPGLDLKRAFPQRDITTWHLVLRDFELDKEPHSTVALCDYVARIGELQALVQEHSIQKSVILVARRSKASPHRELKAEGCFAIPRELGDV